MFNRSGQLHPSTWLSNSNHVCCLFSQGMAATGWVMVSDLAPTKLVGLAGGIFNVAANLSGILTPIIIGIIVQKTHSFTGALIYMAVLALSGALSLLFVVGKIQRLELKE